MSQDQVATNDLAGKILPNPAAWNGEVPELVIREMREEDSRDVKEFCLNNLMQRTRLSNQYVYKSPLWLSIYLSAIALATHHIEPWVYGDWGRWAFLCCAISALFLVGIDYVTYRYYEKDTKQTYDNDRFLRSPKDFVLSKSGKCWLAIYNNTLVGTIVADRSGSQSKSVEIKNWFVKARYRTKGLGGDLLREAVKQTKDTRGTKVFAKTSSINVQANRTLKKSGFSRTSASKDDNLFKRVFKMKNFQWTIEPEKFSLPEL